MRVKCIKNPYNRYDDITIGKVYEVLKEDNYYYQIIDDSKDAYYHLKGLFKEVIK